jgi:integrase
MERELTSPALPDTPNGCTVSPDAEILPPLPKIPQDWFVSLELAISREARLSIASLTPQDPVYRYVKAAEDLADKSKSPATNRAYNSDWRHFVEWCEKMRLAPLPAEPHAVASYLAFLAEPAEDSGEKARKAATITRRLTIINLVHKTAGFEAPSSAKRPMALTTLRGIRRTFGTKQTQKWPLTSDDILKILKYLEGPSATEGPIAAARSKALVLIGFACASRRSELAAMECKDLKRHRNGITINLPRSKTDQEGMGRDVEVPFADNDRTCAVVALDRWLKIAGIISGRLFRSVGKHGSIGKGLHPDSVGEILKDLVSKAGIPNAELYGGHSLRAGYVTEASAAGATDREIMQQTGHSSVAMVHRYSRADQEDRRKTTKKLKLFSTARGGSGGEMGA